LPAGESSEEFSPSEQEMLNACVGWIAPSSHKATRFQVAAQKSSLTGSSEIPDAQFLSPVVSTI